MKTFYKKSAVLWLFLLLFILVLAFSSSLLTAGWKTYKSDDFGFSFKYPSSWHISGNPVSKDEISKVKNLVFWIDVKEELPIEGQDVIRSPGNVQVWINKKPTTFLEEQRRHQDFSKFKTVRFGAKEGSLNEYFYDKSPSLKGRLLASKSLYLETSDYVYYVNTLTSSSDSSLWSKLKARYYHWIGSNIIDGFEFTK